VCGSRGQAGCALNRALISLNRALEPFSRLYRALIESEHPSVCVAAEWEQDAGGAEGGGGDERGSAAAAAHKRSTAEGESGSGTHGGVPASPGETGRGAGGGGHALWGGGGRGSAREREREAWLERERGRSNEEMCVEDLLPSVVFSRDRKRDVEREYGVPPLAPAYGGGGAPVHAAGMSRLVLEAAGEGRPRGTCVRDTKSSPVRAGEEQVVLEQDEEEDEDEDEDEDDEDAEREEENARGKEPCRPRSLLFYTFHPIL
jgi:hypothetical protein